MSQRLKIAGLCLILGLVVEALTLQWTHPLAFIFFIAPGGLLITVGVLLYVWSLLARAPVAESG